MKNYFLSLILTCFLVSPAWGAEIIEDEASLMRIVLSLQDIMQRSLDTQQAEKVLASIPQAQRFEKEGVYQGYKLFDKRDLLGLLSVKYKDDKPLLAAYTTVPLRVRHATNAYKLYRAILLRQYKEITYNHFDLGNGVIAELSKKQRSVSIFLTRQ